MVMIVQSEFKVGRLVRWCDRFSLDQIQLSPAVLDLGRLDSLCHPRRLYGEGPFEVISTHQTTTASGITSKFAVIKDSTHPPFRVFQNRLEPVP